VLLIDPHRVHSTNHELLIIEAEGQTFLVRISKGFLKLQSVQIPFLVKVEGSNIIN